MSSRCRVALLGFGTVGSAVARRLTAPDAGASSNVQLTHIFGRRAGQKRAALRADGITWTSSVDDVLQSDADVSATSPQSPGTGRRSFLRRP